MRVKELTVGAGKQLDFGGFKSHVSFVYTVPEDATDKDVEMVVMMQGAECDRLVRRLLEEQVHREMLEGKIPAKILAKFNPAPRTDDKDDVNF